MTHESKTVGGEAHDRRSGGDLERDDLKTVGVYTHGRGL